MDLRFDQSSAAVTIVVAGTEWGSTVNRVIVERSTGSGWDQIRGGDFTVLGGYVVVSDSEMPLHSTVTYRVRGYNGTVFVTTVAGTVSTVVGSHGVFVKVASDPNAGMQVEVIGDSIEIESSTQGGVYDIANGGTVAVSAWSGVNADRFTLPLRTYDKHSTDELRGLLAKSRIVLLQPCVHEPFPEGWYFVQSVSSKLRGGGQILEGREWSLSLVRTGIPSGDSAGVAGMSWAQVTGSYATWADLMAAYPTWFDVMAG